MLAGAPSFVDAVIFRPRLARTLLWFATTAALGLRLSVVRHWQSFHWQQR